MQFQIQIGSFVLRNIEYAFMETDQLQPLIDNYHRKISKINLQFKRYLHNQINWESRIICIKGARGVGKTTMLLQHILENYQDIDNTLYASLDDLWFSSHSLIDLVDWADSHGIHRLYLDEVHRYERWSETLKNIYDSYPDMSIIYTSSSLLLMDNAKVDLSRRQTSYTLHSMSFREFLCFENITTMPAVPIEELLGNHVDIAMQLVKEFKPALLFEKYLKSGCYPFYRETENDFHIRLREIVSVVIDSDLTAVEKMAFETIQKVKKLIMIISANVPFQPNMSELWRQLATNNELGLRMLYALDRAQILSLLTSETKNYKALHKPDKILMSNTNLMYALCPVVNTGNKRETFFNNQLSVAHDVKLPSKGDFIVDNKYLFEVGGRKKSFEQIADIPNSFLAVDNTEIGYRNRIPLWLFGLSY